MSIKLAQNMLETQKQSKLFLVRDVGDGYLAPVSLIDQQHALICFPQVGQGEGELKAAREDAEKARKRADDLQQHVEELEVREQGLHEELEGFREALRAEQDASKVALADLRWDDAFCFPSFCSRFLFFLSFSRVGA